MSKLCKDTLCEDKLCVDKSCADKLCNISATPATQSEDRYRCVWTSCV